MDANERIIHGTFTNSDETIAAIRRLNEEGYSKDSISVYSNNDDFKTFDATEGKPRSEEGSFDVTDRDSRPRSRDGSFDITDENSKQRSGQGSFDRVDREKGSNDQEKKEDGDESSLWESVKDFFTPETYNHENQTQNPDYNPDDDILYPYRDNISQGHYVVVLQNQNMDPGRNL